MTERKPFGVSWETWIDRQIREGMERGDFDHLPGHGQPIRGLDRPDDELWWVREKLRREGVSFLPPTLAPQSPHRVLAGVWQAPPAAGYQGRAPPSTLH